MRAAPLPRLWLGVLLASVCILVAPPLPRPVFPATVPSVAHSEQPNASDYQSLPLYVATALPATPVAGLADIGSGSTVRIAGAGVVVVSAVVTAVVAGLDASATALADQLAWAASPETSLAATIPTRYRHPSTAATHDTGLAVLDTTAMSPPAGLGPAATAVSEREHGRLFFTSSTRPD